jgi:uncharacterized protein (TIGR03086 family)
MLMTMTRLADDVVDRFVVASEGFASRLRLVDAGGWQSPTPCPAWDVRALVNHVARGNLNYVLLRRGGDAAEFVRMRDADALGGDPVNAFDASVRQCADAYREPGALDVVADHPSGRLSGRQALAVRTTDTVIHTWDLARAIGADDSLDPALLLWIDTHLYDIYAGMAETPVAAQTSNRFFAAPDGDAPGGSSIQDRLLHLFGRRPAWPA